MREAAVFLVMLCFLLFSSLGATDWTKDDFEITGCDDKDFYVVVGTNNGEFTHTHPVSGLPCTEDLYNAQMAVDNYNYVKLKGTFHMGELEVDDDWNLLQDGILMIRNPDVVLKGPATLMYGGGWWQIVVAAPGVKIMNLHFVDGWDVGIHMRVPEDAVGDPIMIARNYFETDLAIDSFYPVICGLIIKNNKIITPHTYSMWISGTYWWDDDPPKVPAVIINNQIHCEDYDENYTEAISLGGFAMAMDYAFVKGNTITGNALVGINAGMYVDNSKIMHNDLSGLSTWIAQVWLGGEKNKVYKNTFGKATDDPAIWFEPDPYWPDWNVAVTVNNEHWGDGDPQWTRYNKIMNNDYRLCGLDKGWLVDATTGEIYSRGCIVLDPVEFEAGLGLEKNIVAEHLFPEGTTVCDQVWDMNGKNYIKGWEWLCEDGDGYLAKSISGEISTAAQIIAEHKNTRMERIAQKEEYLNRYLAKHVKTEMAPISVIPQKFDLAQNYPNPFNPTTMINYELPITNYVDLSIYNALGQRMATLVSENQSAGSYQVSWDASQFASGIYYYRIEAGEFQAVKKMILLR